MLRSLPVLLLVGAVLSAVLAPPLTAQEPAGPGAATFVHESWTVENGLPVNAIQRVARGSEGYLWLATWDGLVRFDGARFTVFNTGNTAVLPSNRLADMVASADGSLWLRTEQDHLVRLRGGEFTHFDSTRGLRDRSLRSLSVDSTGAVLVGTTSGVLQLVNDRFEPVARGTITEEATALLHARDGSIWVGTRGGALFRVVNGTAQPVAVPDGAARRGAITILRADRFGVTWAGTTAGLLRIRGQEAERVRLPSGRAFAQSVSDLRLAADGAVWVAAASGVFVVDGDVLQAVRETPGRVTNPGVRFHPDGGVWYAVGDRLYHDGRIVFRVPLRDSAEVRSIKQIEDFGWDAEGSLWIGTYNNGLFRLKPSVFQVFSAREGIAERNVATVAEDRRTGAIWIGTMGGGLSRLVGDSVTNYTPARGYPRFVLSLLAAADGTLWIGTLQEGVLQCRLPAMRCVPPSIGDGLSGATVRALHEDAAGDLWVGSEQGLFRRRGERWERMDGTPAIASGPVRSFLEARDGTLFMGTNGAGVLVFRAGRLSAITTAHGLPSDLVRSLHLDERGSLWVGTEGRGLARVRTEVTGDGEVIAAETRTIRQRQGLFDEVIHQILPDAFGRLWMSTNRGIFWTTRADLDAVADGRMPRVHSTSFTERDGLRNREANGGQSPAGIAAGDGRLWFATQDGAAVVNPARTRSNAVPPPVLVEQLATNTRVLRPDGELALAADEREFSIDYTALSFLAPENVRFRYRLEGFNDAWIDAGNRRTAFYTNVPPGTYTFRVVASNNDGVWNDVGSAFTLRVAPRFHETPAAWLLLALTLGLTLAVGARWRLQQLRVREHELTALVAMRTAELERNQRQLSASNMELAELHQARSRLFANLSHEFRTPLSLILGPLNGLQEGRHGSLGASAREQVAMMTRNAQRLLRLINRILDLSRAEEGGLILDAEPQDVVAFTRALVEAFTPLTRERQLTLDFDSVAPALIVRFDAEQLEKVLLNLLSNAVKFTPDGGAVHVTVEVADGRAVIRVQDTGVGVPPDEVPRLFDRFYRGRPSAEGAPAGSGIGLALARELVMLHDGTIAAESTPGVGSVFTVRLPLVNAEPRADASAVAEDPPATDRAARKTVDASTRGDEDRTTVLVVDDHAEMRAHVRSILAPRFRVLEASDGRAALAQCTTDLPDLVIADVTMPELDGLALSRSLRADPLTAAIPVVLLTARASARDQIAGFETGVDAYLTKPFDAGVLMARVENLLEQRQRLRPRVRQGEVVPMPPVTGPVSALDARLRPIVQANVHDSEFGADELAGAAGMSYHQLYRRLREELGSTPSRYIRGVRVECAAELLQRDAGTVTQVAYAVGFESLSYFRRAFRERFGTSPGDYIRQTSTVDG